MDVTKPRRQEKEGLLILLRIHYYSSSTAKQSSKQIFAHHIKDSPSSTKDKRNRKPDNKPIEVRNLLCKLMLSFKYQYLMRSNIH